MENLDHLNLIRGAGDLLDAGYHCSEAILLAIGRHYLGDVHPQALRMATPFAAGVGDTCQEMCGALTGGLMVIGGLFGRTDGSANDDRCQLRAAAYRAEFLRAFGWLRCRELKEHWIGTAGQDSCRMLVEKAAGVLVGVMEAEKPG